MRVSALLALRDLAPVLASLADAFDGKAKEFDDILKSGRTHLQYATPIRLGQEFAAYAEAVRSAAEAIATAAQPLHALGLGGSAVGTGINTHPDYRRFAMEHLARITALPFTPAADMRFAMQSCAAIATVSGALRSLGLEIIRISNDLHPDRCANYAASTVALAPALNPYIGYRRAAEVAKQSVASGQSIVTIVRDEELLTEAQIATILDARAMTEPRAPEAKPTS